jgi:adenosine deaminase
MTERVVSVGGAWAKRLLAGVVLAALMVGVASAAATYTYDVFTRVTQVAYDNGLTLTYAYDAAANRTSVAVISAALCDRFFWAPWGRAATGGDK